MSRRAATTRLRAALAVLIVWLSTSALLTAEVGDLPTSSIGPPLPEITLFALDAGAQRAVLKLADGKLRLVKPGDAIGDEGGPLAQVTVEKVTGDKLIVEQVTRETPPVRRQLWVHLGDDKSKPSHVQIFDPRAPAETPAVTPKLIPQMRQGEPKPRR